MTNEKRRGQKLRNAKLFQFENFKMNLVLFDIEIIFIMKIRSILNKHIAVKTVNQISNHSYNCKTIREFSNESFERFLKNGFIIN